MSPREEAVEKAKKRLREKGLTEGIRIGEILFWKDSSNIKIRVGACEDRIVDFFCEGKEKEYFDALCEKIKDNDSYTRKRGRCFTANSSDIVEQCDLLCKLFHIAD